MYLCNRFVIMKRLFLYVQFLILTTFANATGQESDIIFIDGAKWELLGRPVCADSTLYYNLKAVLPKERSISTANWDGFTAFWSITQDKLYLDSIRCIYYDSHLNVYVGKRIPTDTLRHVFRKYVDETRILASWLTQDVRVASGKVIYYQHLGFERNYEEEKILRVNQGKIIEQNVFHNFVVEGFSFDRAGPDFQAKLKKMFPLHIERYQELADVKRIVFSIKRAGVDAEGNLVECELKAFKPEVDNRLAEEMTALMKAYKPWRALYINGEFRAYGIEGYTFPYVIDKQN